MPLLEAGLRAPSAENKHYLRFRVGADAVELWTTDADTWAEQPHRRLLAFLSYGAVVENIDLCSAAAGWRLQAELLPDPARPAAPVARLRWTAAVPVLDPLVAAISTRHTNRRFYRRQRLLPETLTALAAAAAAVPGAGVAWLDDAASRRLGLQAMRIAEAERFRGRRLHAELFGAVRFEHGWQGGLDEWLAPAALEVEPPMRAAFAALRHRRVMRLAQALGGPTLLGLRAGYLPAASAPHLGMIHADAATSALATLAAGRAFQRLWLQAALAGVALQPMAAATALARQRPGDGWVRPAVQARLRRLLAQLMAERGGEPFMLFRIGKASAPTATAGRRAVEEFVDRADGTGDDVTS